MPFDAEKAADVKDITEKLKKTYKNISPTAARQAIHVFNSVMESTGDEGRAWASVYSKLNERGLSKKTSSAQRVASRYAALKVAYREFVNFVRGDNAKKCFLEAQQNARGGSGYDYAGTIGEKEGFVLRSQEPMSKADARYFIDVDLDENDRGGPAFAVPVSDPSGKRVSGYFFYGIA